MADYPVPAGVAERLLVLRTCGLAIPAAFTMPTSRPATAALLFIPGSLFSDVNGDYPSWNSFPGTNAYLAHQFAERGIATLRFAKAGPGTGTVVEDKPLWDTHRTWDGRVTIARAALALLRATLAAESLSVPVIIAGHSEGAVVASRLAAEHAAETAAQGVVLLAGPAVGILSVMRERSVREAPESERAQRERDMTIVVDAIMAGQPIPDAQRGLPMIGGLVTMPPEALVYLSDCERSDPCVAAAGIDAPVLIVQGTGDLNVTLHDADRLTAARGARPTQRLVLEGLSHMFKRVPPGSDAAQAFSWPGPCDEGVADGVAAWIRGL